MSARVVAVPRSEHRCSPGWEEFFQVDGIGGPGWRLRPVHHEPGSVVECACGRTWVALEHIYSGTRIGSGIIHGGWNDYRPETRRERKRRLKAAS